LADARHPTPISGLIRSEACAVGIGPHWCLSLGRRPSGRGQALLGVDTQLAGVTPCGSDALWLPVVELDWEDRRAAGIGP
jgi:hypothetical protein